MSTSKSVFFSATRSPNINWRKSSFCFTVKLWHFPQWYVGLTDYCCSVLLYICAIVNKKFPTGCLEETVKSFVPRNVWKVVISKGFVNYLEPTVQNNLVTTYSTTWKQLFSSFISKFLYLLELWYFLFISDMYLLTWVPGKQPLHTWGKCGLWWCLQAGLCWGVSSGQPYKSPWPLAVQHGGAEA